MPIVPTMTAPTVQENVGSAPHIQAHVPSSQAYERTFATAMKTLNDGIDNAVKAMEVADARYIKSQSDDAETQVINAINTSLYDKDSGYFTQKGVNAINTFDSTLKGLNERITGITDKLDPRVNEVLKSRLDQRMAVATNSMHKWYAQQASHYNITSSENRVKTLTADRALHHSDPNYIRTTDESVKAELILQGKEAGSDSETVNQKYKDWWNKAEAERYSTMADDMPQDAWNAFNLAKDKFDPKTRDKIEKDLKAKFVYNCYGALKGTEAARTLDPDKRVELEGFFNLDRRSQRIMLGLAHSEMTQEIQLSKNAINKELAKRKALAKITGMPQLFTEEDFSLFGDASNDMMESANSAITQEADAVRLQNMSITQGMEYAKQYEDSGDVIRAAQIRHTVSVNQKNMEKDPVAVAGSQFGFSPLTSDMEQNKLEIKYRIQAAKDLQRQNALPSPAILSNAELDSLIQDVSNKETFLEQSAVLRNWADMLGPEGIRIISSQLKPKNAVLAIAMAKVDDRVEGESGPSVGMKILEGNYYLKNNKAVSLEKGLPNELVQIFGSVDDPSAVFNSQSALDAEVQAAKCMYAYDVVRGNSTSAKDAVRQVVGTIDKVNGKRCVMSEGMDADDTIEYVKSYIGGLNRKIGIVGLKGSKYKFTPEEITSNAHSLQLQTYGKSSSGKASYLIRTNSGYLSDKDGTPLLIEVPTRKDLDSIQTRKTTEQDQEEQKSGDL